MQFCGILCGSGCGSTGLTHTVTHTPKCLERDRECQTGSFAFLPGCFSVSYDLRHKISHRLRCLILHLPGGVGVGAEGESGVVVTQHTADCFHVYPILECQGREGVPLWHNKDKPENPCVARSWRLALILFPLKTARKWDLREGVIDESCT